MHNVVLLAKKELHGVILSLDDAADLQQVRPCCLMPYAHTLHCVVISSPVNITLSDDIKLYIREASLQLTYCIVLNIQQAVATQERLLPCNGAMILFQNIDEAVVNVKANAATWDVELVVEHGESGTMSLGSLKSK